MILTISSRVETPAGYYPRNCSSIPLPGPNELVNLEDGFLVREIKAALPPMGRTGFEELLSPTPFTAKVRIILKSQSFTVSFMAPFV